MKQQSTVYHNVAVGLAAVLIVCRCSPAHAEVLSVTLGVAPSCPYGLTA